MPEHTAQCDRQSQPAIERRALADAYRLTVRSTVDGFTAWLARFGETSFDHQSFFAGPLGGRAKALYYRHRRLGTVAVAPMIVCEALVPSARRLFWRKMRFPIADAHYAMGFAYLARLPDGKPHLEKAKYFLDILERTRSPGYRFHCWGYPFDWVTQTGVHKAGMPFITTLPYVYEAFEAVWKSDHDPRWIDVMRSIADHALHEIGDRELRPGVASAAYHPQDREALVVNASAYRAFLLYSAAARFADDGYAATAARNLAYVLQAQRPDGSWPYATDGVRDFVDHFHTCFVLKALAKIERLRPDPKLVAAIDRGVAYYVGHLFDKEELPKPFAVPPRLVVYRRELYDYAECINLATLLRGRYADLDARLETTLTDLLAQWRKPDGSFRSRRLMLGWDNVPMHRWAQSQVFRALCQWLLVTDDEPPGDEPVVTHTSSTIGREIGSSKPSST
ncbi:MAG: hypothetical protein KJ018_05100 [Burkholderiales bacterium]|nr:hypothetical protein [Burkholderiales bacterium]